MVRGFYDLTSGMLTQNRTLNTVSNNIANTNTNGYKSQRLTSRTFGDMLIERVDAQRTPIGHASLMNITADKTVTDFTQGTIQPTDRALDFAIRGDGFFAVQTNDGVAYTRNGSFNMDTQGYLTLNGVGRVLGRNGQPIQLNTDNVESDKQGNLYIGGNLAASLGVYRFPDNRALNIVNEGLYAGANATLVQTPEIVP